MGLSEYVAKTADDYVRLAVQLATDPVRRAGARSAILEMNSVLFENMAVVREIEEHLSGALRSVSECSFG
jgi:predicted O-linked N-acetylglucosamine transferase (SPINDLY family)